MFRHRRLPGSAAEGTAITQPHVDQRLVELNAQSLAAAARGDTDEAVELADRAADEGSLLGVALSTYLRTSKRHDVYDQPAAFEAFIAGGGNVDLYRQTSRVLSDAYPGVGTLLDIGCGNGHALIPALQQSPTVPSVTDLVEPGAALLDHCLAAIAQAALPVTTTAWPMGLTDFLTAAPAGQRWQLAQSTFALQSIEPAERLAALTALAPRVDRLMIVDFDAAADEVGGASRLRSLAARYERGLAEYDETRDLVAQGFLIPVLLGQLSPDTPRTNWEHPAQVWLDQVKAAGFGNIVIRPLADYWSAPAFVLTATGSVEPEPWDSGDTLTPADWGRQEQLNHVADDLRRIGDTEPGHGPYISGEINLQQYSLTVWWFGPLPAAAQAVIDRARANGITVAVLEAPFSKADLHVTLGRIQTGTHQPDIGRSMIIHNHDGSGFTVHFNSAEQAAAAAQAVERIRAAAADGREPADADLPFAALYAPDGPPVTIAPQPMQWQYLSGEATAQPGSAPATT